MRVITATEETCEHIERIMMLLTAFMLFYAFLLVIHKGILEAGEVKLTSPCLSYIGRF
jgi:hypothetical protein